jgi:hypothetical protein
MHAQSECNIRSMSLILGAAEPGVRAFPGADRVLRRAEPPQRLPQTVESLRRFRIPKCNSERITRPDPVTGEEGALPLLDQPVGLAGHGTF